RARPSEPINPIPSQPPRRLSSRAHQLARASAHQPCNPVAEDACFGALHHDTDVVEVEVGPARVRPASRSGLLPRIRSILPCEVHELSGHAWLRLDLRLTPLAGGELVVAVVRV